MLHRNRFTFSSRIATVLLTCGVSLSLATFAAIAEAKQGNLVAAEGLLAELNELN